MEINTILVTGAAGFLGSHLCRLLLKENYTVIGVDNFCCGFERNISDLRENKRFIFIESDVRSLTSDDILRDLSNRSDYKNIDVCYHLAARGELYWCNDNPVQAVDINVGGTIKVLDICKKLNCKHFAFADTSAEYDAVTEFPSKEYTAPTSKSPTGIYSISKMAAAQYVRSLSPRYNMTYSIFRYFNIYGPSLNLVRDIPPVIGSMSIRMIEGKSPIIYGTGEKRRDFIYVSDVNLLHFKLIKILENGSNIQSVVDTFNVGTGINFSVNDIYNLVSIELFKREYERWIPPEYKEDSPYEAFATLADISKTRSVFDWYPKVEIEEGINRVVQSIKSDMNAIVR